MELKAGMGGAGAKPQSFSHAAVQLSHNGSFKIWMLFYINF